MSRLAAMAVVLGVVAALSGCATPCCFCYCGEVPTQGLLDVADEPRPEIAPSLQPALKPALKPVVVARY